MTEPSNWMKDRIDEHSGAIQKLSGQIIRLDARLEQQERLAHDLRREIAEMRSEFRSSLEYQRGRDDKIDEALKAIQSDLDTAKGGVRTGHAIAKWVGFSGLVALGAAVVSWLSKIKGG